jgi:hypothetical protein
MSLLEPGDIVRGICGLVFWPFILEFPMADPGPEPMQAVQ